jgi:hypothetical protein
MNKSVFRVAFCVVLALTLGGCEMLNFASDWFSSSKKTKLKGERISVMSLDESLKPDPTLKDMSVTLPPP